MKKIMVITIVIMLFAVFTACAADTAPDMNKPAEPTEEPGAEPAMPSVDSDMNKPAEPAEEPGAEPSMPTVMTLTQEQTDMLLCDVAGPITTTLAWYELYDIDYSVSELDEAFMSRYLFAYIWNHESDYVTDYEADTTSYTPHVSNVFFYGEDESQSAFLLEKEGLEKKLTDAFGEETAASLDAELIFPGGVYPYYFGDFNYWTDAHAMEEPLSFQDGAVIEFTVNEEMVGEDAFQDGAFTLYLTLEADTASEYGCVVTDIRLERNPADGALSAPAGFDENGFLFADSGERYLTPEELIALDAEMLGFARNEIFARHGEIFSTEKYDSHYSQYEWYNAMEKQDDVSDMLNDFEKTNVEIIQQYEGEL